MIINFEQFLEDEFSRDYVGLDDNWPDSYDDWIADLDTDDWIRLAQKFAVKTAKDQVNVCHKNTLKIIEETFNAKS